jgi:hypothetical protein
MRVAEIGHAGGSDPYRELTRSESGGQTADPLREIAPRLRPRRRSPPAVTPDARNALRRASADDVVLDAKRGILLSIRRPAKVPP